jgi:hypothetical protein
MPAYLQSVRVYIPAKFRDASVEGARLVGREHKSCETKNSCS